MARGACALALLCAFVVGAAAYTVDCNHEYTDCDTELSKLTSEDDDTVSTLPPIAPTDVETSLPVTTSTTPAPRSTSAANSDENHENKTVTQTTTEANEITEPISKPKPRLLNLNVDELQNFANALHNQTKGTKKTLDDLSDVNLDEDEEETPRTYGNEARNKQIAGKFYANLQTPFNPLLTVDKSEEIETCKENGVTYKIGDHVDRGCDESCECTPGGVFECAPRCKHPFIRRGRRLNDPLCFESPVDECCSIVACVTGNGEPKPTTLEVCRYANETYTVGEKWHIGCEQTCSCEPKSVVTCKPRCKPLPQSDKCINVQNPKDECCEMQICDVSQDAHEEPADLTNSSSTTEMPKKSQGLQASPLRPLVLAEPIGSVKVLQNNTVQVNLIHLNNSKDPIHLLLSSDGGNTYNDIELKYSNLILNLEGGKDYILKTKETGTKFNFTVTASDLGNEVEEPLNRTKNGCYHDGKFYAVGEEFQIGCKELCECTGKDEQECAPLQCPTHVGLELLSRGCVVWAPSPPATPPTCCPRTARCLSDGTCHYKGEAIPNWSEVPISLTGCEEHCFCENGSLDCQPACAPLPPLPPQYLRCPPLHHPGPVNASDDYCCKVWGCVPNAGNMNAYPTITPTRSHTINYVTPVPSIIPTITSFLPTPPQTTKINQFYGRFSPVKTTPIFLKAVSPQHILNDSSKYLFDHPDNIPGRNITVFTPEDIDSPFKTIQPEPPLVSNTIDWRTSAHSKVPLLANSYNIHTNPFESTYSQNTKPSNIVISDDKLHDIIQGSKYGNDGKLPILSSHDFFVKQISDSQSVKKMPLSEINDINYFHPFYDKLNNPSKSNQIYFEPTKVQNKTTITTFNVKGHPIIHNLPEKHVTILKNKELKYTRPILTKSTIMIPNTRTHLLAKEPNPYETILLRLLPNSKTSTKLTSDPTLHIPRVPTKPYSTLDLEHLLNQMELESETNKNLGRSADKSHRSKAAGKIPHGSGILPPPTPPAFFPTIPTEEPEDEHNNIHEEDDPEIPGRVGLPLPNLPSDDNKKLLVLSIQGDSPTSIKMLFGLPPVLVGLRGSVDLRYTDSMSEDISQWNSQVFAPADEILTTPRLEFRLTGLKPSTTYKIRGKLYLHNLPVEPESEIYTVKTQDVPTVIQPEERRREIDCELTVVEVNDTTARVTWKHFSEDELQFIDGIQVRYRQTGTPIFSMTELLHHSRQGATLQELHPGSRYEASLVMIPPPRATVELFDPNTVEFTTAPYIDPYNWTVTIEVRSIGSEAAELAWRGIPNPPERWVRVFRAAHACGKLRKEHDSFRLATRDEPNIITLTGLEPEAKCRVWLELFLSNGKVKTSNVLEIHTKSLDSPETVDNIIEASSVSGRRGPPRGDYYGALVAVGVVAALAALAAVLLLLVVVRRHRPRSVPITSVPSAPRESSLPPYDNPAYKLELQQETMDL